MNLLVTGGCGFIGSNFINYIGKNYPNYFIVNIDALYYCANENNVNDDYRPETLNKNVEHHLL